jgi:glutathione S-transferase
MLMVMTITVALLLAWYLWEKHHRRTYAMSGGLHEEILLPHAQEYELYHNGLSLCSKKVRVCLKELGIPFAEHPIDLIETGSYEVVSRHFLKVNPAGLLPVLVHNGHPIYESHDIITYCAQHASDDAPALIPEDTAEREVMESWQERASMKEERDLQVDHSAADCVAVLTVPLFASGMSEIPYHKLLDGLLFHRIKFRPFLFLLLKVRGLGGLPGMPPLVKQLGLAYAAMERHLDELEIQLGEGPWICGEQFTLADVSWMVIFERLAEADWLASLVGPQQRPNIYAYWQRLHERPGYAGISEYRLPIVTRATGRIRDHKQAHPDFAETLTARRKTP